jgi:carbamoyltransferase
MANILGLHFGHDSAAAIVKDGKLVSAISSERITRLKKSKGISKLVLDYVLKEANLTLNEIDVIAFSDYFKDEFDETFRLFNNSNQPYTAFSQTLFGNQTYEALYFQVLDKRIKAIAIPHHLAHCASAFFTSPFKKSLCFSMDSSMGYLASCSNLCYGDGQKITGLYCPAIMVGNLYAHFTVQLGLGDPLFKAGSLMGLASYGKPISRIVKNIHSYVERCYFQDEFRYDAEFAAIWEEISGIEGKLNLNLFHTRLARDIAATVQLIFEESVLFMLKNLKEHPSETELCLSGGSFLNCNLNSRIRNETRFKNIHLFPACGDDGVAVGAALYVSHEMLNEPRYQYKNSDIMYLGAAQEKMDFDYERIAKSILDGKIVGWFNGRSEFGPRALGNRSILADPRNAHNRELLNFVVKKREWFRPFAPSVLEEETQQWFDFSGKSPFMLFTSGVIAPHSIPAVTHVDSSARMQTVSEGDNPEYYNLIKTFHKLSGLPLVLNTSLNLNGEPLVETEADAQRLFRKSDLDVMVINGEVFEK